MSALIPGTDGRESLVGVGATGVQQPMLMSRQARLAELFLRRLRRLLIIRDDHGSRLNAGGLRLVDRAIYSTFCDAVRAGAEREARLLVQGEKRSRVV